MIDKDDILINALQYTPLGLKTQESKKLLKRKEPRALNPKIKQQQKENALSFWVELQELFDEIDSLYATKVKPGFPAARPRDTAVHRSAPDVLILS